MTIVGIDLGTTHTVVAWAESDASVDDAAIRLFEVDQLVAPGEVAARPLLPSLRYHPALGELAAGELQLPWASDETAVIGTLARRLGAQVPGRLVASAKSWLSHAAVDRLAAILPWGAPDEVAKVSPVAASASYLAQVRAAWNLRFPQQPLEQQELVLTVPASFDDAARGLTLEAARLAGLPRLKLLEEPQAAFQDWLFRHRQTLAQSLGDARLVLVCDVGGGTTDLSLIQVEPGSAGPQLRRIAVGQHLMLGGDNMDLALAHLLEPRLSGGDVGSGNTRLSAARLSQLVERCRAAKETLLADDAPEHVTVTLLGSGSKLIGGARSAELSRDEVRRIVVDGFLPRVDLDAPVQRRRGALVEFGLPYASDSAISRHLAAFLREHAAAGLPDALLLNGGVFRAGALAQRLQEQLAQWRGQPLRLLHNANPDIAVARGAVAHTLARRGAAPRLAAGSARSYFLRLDGDQSLCVLPRGAEPGHERPLEGRRFALRLGQPVRFQLLSSTTAQAALGEVVALAQINAQPLPPIATVLKDEAGSRREITVQLLSDFTEVGTLELQAQGEDGSRFKLEFALRGTAGQAGDEETPRLPPQLAEAVTRIDRVFGARAKDVTLREVKQLRQGLEQLLGPRERWDVPLLRHLFDTLWQRARGRRRSADHERLWLNLAGWCLRPGFGDALDDWRVEQLWTLFAAGVAHAPDAQVRAQWWTLWRRVAGGLPVAAQEQLLQDFAFNLQGADAGPRPPHLVPGGEDDMLRLGAALERVPVAHKTEIGAWLLQRLAEPPESALALWALGRLGARQPFHGGAQSAVPAEVAAAWLQPLLALDWKRLPEAAFAAAQLGRLTGDRARDIDADLRLQVIARLEAAQAPPSWVAMLREPLALDGADQRQLWGQMLGEALPPGLRLL